MKDFAVVGSGVGGSSIAAILQAKGYDVALFEKESYLGGCSSSFTHRGYLYNTGATTLSGYEDGYIIKDLFDAIGFRPDVIEVDPSIVILHNGKTTPRYKNFERFFEVVNHNYPHEKNRAFWELIQSLNQDFYQYSGHYYSNKNIFSKIRSLMSFIPLGVKFQKYLRVNAEQFIEEFLEGIDAEYKQFLESQVLIVAQAPLKEVSFFIAALSLAYTFNANHYVVGGFSKLFDEMTQNISEVHTQSEIIAIAKKDGYFELSTKKETFQARKLILNSTVYESGKLFKDESIVNYYKKYEKLNNHQSSFMLYMTIRSDKSFHHHYQIIQDEKYTHTLSHALFVSFSDKNDHEMTPEGYYSITASIHTDSRLWNYKSLYKEQKLKVQEELMQTIQEHLGIKDEEIVDVFSGTSKTFDHYINRSQLGGNPITMKNLLPFLPGNDTKIKNLYNVGDTVYAAQGWPGVMLGVKNLERLLGV
jgi:phytoene dehydrogenase-like protein